MFCFRIIKGSSAEHRINDKVVSHADYNKEMEKINIFIKVKNFLVFQVGYNSSRLLKSLSYFSSLYDIFLGGGDALGTGSVVFNKKKDSKCNKKNKISVQTSCLFITVNFLKISLCPHKIVYTGLFAFRNFSVFDF